VAVIAVGARGWGGYKAGRPPLPACPASGSLSPESQEAQRARWRAKARLQRARRHERGAPTRAQQLVADRTVVGIGPSTCDRCGSPFTPYRMTATTQRFCSPKCRRRAHSANQVRIRYGLRAAVIAASAGVCYLCTRPIDASLAAPHPLSLSIDHVKPLAMGGTNALENLRATHLGCNVEKGDQLPPWWIAS
jgi:5-methylcytosine-specific restriction endonuclease McrA